MSEWKLYTKRVPQRMRPYVPGEDLSAIFVATVDAPPELGGMIARNDANHNDQWYVAKKFFEDNYVPFKKAKP